MCRLFGLRANRPVDVEFSLVKSTKPFREFGEGNPDGWGVGWYSGGTPHVEKEPIRANVSETLPLIAAREKSHVFVSHVRQSTGTAVCRENCHPFCFEEWLFAHNGSVNREDLIEKLDERHHAALRGTTDSEVYFHWVIQNIEEAGDSVQGIRRALATVKSDSGLNFLLTDGVRLFAYRNSARNASYYSLFFLERDPGLYEPETLQSGLGVLIESKLLWREKAVLVCSEELTKEAWREISLRNLLVVSADLEPEVVEVK
jgi:glutamine amidotransferase